ncbi:hypothetical protein R1CP_36450 (plasmid) [Rhodococcus opacus]|uniref:Uncharacterized protein n=1 Tax=Rhodococcus opacus TaxID=37919 RepID=A0A1B1KH12_RHOOP|nr:hypothetical protein [Rhodococcus opacus]ANS31896.1 hypothetical protein R1CP_36450 [Rhodococcus opacus]
MHTSLLKFNHFAVEADGAPSTVPDIFPAWHKHQRFGIVIQEPLGHVGASLLIQAATATFFDHLFQNTWADVPVPDEELPGPSFSGTYPEIYAFHVGRRHGTLSAADFWPGYKEILVEADPARVLQEINGRGITVLAVPEGEEKSREFIWPEHRTFLWRTESVFSYHASGRVVDPDISISSLDDEPETNVDGMLDPVARVEEFRAFNPERTRVEAEGMVLEGNALDDLKRFLADVDGRHYEVSDADRAKAVAARRAVRTDGRSVETYRRRDANYALRRLVP